MPGRGLQSCDQATPIGKDEQGMSVRRFHRNRVAYFHPLSSKPLIASLL